MAGSPQPVRIDTGISGSDIREFAGLGAALTGCERSGVQCPLIAALMLFSKLDFPERASLFTPRPGRVLVQEYLSIASFGPVIQDQPILVVSAFHPSPDESGIATIEARVSNTAQEPIVDLKAVLRVVPVATFIEPGPVLHRAATGTGALRLQTRAFEDAHVGRYLALVGDTNLVHSNRAVIASLGLPDAVVPGGLIAALAEPAVEQFFEGAEIVSMRIRFTAPVFLGAMVDIHAQVRQVGVEGRPRDVRLFFVNPGGNIASMADLVLRDRKTGQLTSGSSHKLADARRQRDRHSPQNPDRQHGPDHGPEAMQPTLMPQGVAEQNRQCDRDDGDLSEEFQEVESDSVAADERNQRSREQRKEIEHQRRRHRSEQKSCAEKPGDRE